VTGGTIATAALTVSRTAPATAISGVILAVGTIPGQEVVVLNESASALTFATSATSHVSTGTTCIIVAQTSLHFVWDSVTALWYPAGGIAPVSFSLNGAILLPGLTVGGTLVTPPASNVLSGAIVLRGLSVSGALATGTTTGLYGDGLYGSGLYGQ
jgi:hypothetical protein